MESSSELVTALVAAVAGGVAGGLVAHISTQHLQNRNFGRQLKLREMDRLRDAEDNAQELYVIIVGMLAEYRKNIQILEEIVSETRPASDNPLMKMNKGVGPSRSSLEVKQVEARHLMFLQEHPKTSIIAHVLQTTARYQNDIDTLRHLSEKWSQISSEYMAADQSAKSDPGMQRELDRQRARTEFLVDEFNNNQRMLLGRFRDNEHDLALMLDRLVEAGKVRFGSDFGAFKGSN